MAKEITKRTPDLLTTLTKEPYRFKFFQMMRLLEKLWQREFGDKPFFEQGMRLKGHLSLTFPVSEIVTLLQDEGHDWPKEVFVTFIGLTGSMGVLPRHYTEELIARKNTLKDITAQSFFDIFHHRVLSLFYQAWKKYNLWVGVEQHGTSPLAKHLLDFTGLGTKGLQNRLGEIDDEYIAYYSGLIAQTPRNFSNLQAILEDMLGFPVIITAATGRYLYIPITEQARFSLTTPLKLSDNITLGSQIWDISSHFTLTLYPKTREDYESCLKDGRYFSIITTFITYYMGLHFDVDIKLTMPKALIPLCHISNEPQKAARLGMTSWIGQKTFDDDVSDCVLNIRS